MEPSRPWYNSGCALRLSGPLDVAALGASLDAIVRRHAILRTTFPVVGGEPQQVIAAAAALPLPVVDLSALPPDAREARARQLAEEETRQPFDLGRGPLLRASLLRLEPQDHLLVLALHHIIFDGWSQGVLLRELAACYAAAHAGHDLASAPILPPLPLQYAEFAVRQQEQLTGALLARQLDYWRKQLAGAPPLLGLPTDRPRPAYPTAQGARSLRAPARPVRRPGRVEPA